MLSLRSTTAAAGGPATGAALASAVGPGAAAVLLRCEVGGESYCIEGARVAAIERAERLVREPGEDGRIGWLSGHGGGPRGRLGTPGRDERSGAESVHVPVYSLAALLGLPDAGGAGAQGPVLVIGGAERWALQVDRVARAAAGPAEAPLPLPAAVTASCGGRFTAALGLGDRLALVIAPDHLRPRDGAADGSAAEGSAAGASAAGAPSSTRNGSRSSSPSAAAAPRPAVRRPGAMVLFSADSDGRHGGMLFGLSLAQVEEVLRAVPVTPVPGAAGDLLGLIVWRHRAVPVIDLGRRLGPRGAGGAAARTHGTAAGRLLVARAVRRPEWIAFPVRADLRVEPLPLPSRAWADGPRISPLAALGVFELAAGTVVVPDVDGILTPDRAAPEGGRAARSAGEERGESDEES